MRAAMLSSLPELVAKWPPAVFAGVLFFVLWVPIVLLAAALTWTRNRLGWMVPITADRGDWKRAVIGLLLLGMPTAVGFGALFAFRSVPLLVGVGVVIAIVLIGVVLPRLNRW
jgi:hypothetical protein